MIVLIRLFFSQKVLLFIFVYLLMALTCVHVYLHIFLIVTVQCTKQQMHFTQKKTLTGANLTQGCKQSFPSGGSQPDRLMHQSSGQMDLLVRGTTNLSFCHHKEQLKLRYRHLTFDSEASIVLVAWGCTSSLSQTSVGGSAAGLLHTSEATTHHSLTSLSSRSPMISSWSMLLKSCTRCLNSNKCEPFTASLN